MNSITDLLDLEDSEIIVDDIQIQNQSKTIVLSTVPTAHFCPSCGFKMHSRGIEQSTTPFSRTDIVLFLSLSNAVGAAQILTADMIHLKALSLLTKIEEQQMQPIYLSLMLTEI